MMNVLTQVNEFLEGIPGHKNLIWLAGVFPLALVPRKEDPREYEDQLITEINVLTRAQVAVYPINVGGVPVNPPGMLTGARVHGGNNNQNVQAGGPIQGSGGGGLSSLPISRSLTDWSRRFGLQSSGDSMYTDYDVQKALAEATGGHAFYSTNDVTAALDEATDIGGNYYSLTYSPTNSRMMEAVTASRSESSSPDTNCPIAASISPAALRPKREACESPGRGRLCRAGRAC